MGQNTKVTRFFNECFPLFGSTDKRPLIEISHGAWKNLKEGTLKTPTIPN